MRLIDVKDVLGVGDDLLPETQWQAEMKQVRLFSILFWYNIPLNIS